MNNKRNVFWPDGEMYLETTGTIWMSDWLRDCNPINGLKMGTSDIARWRAVKDFCGPIADPATWIGDMGLDG